MNSPRATSLDQLHQNLQHMEKCLMQEDAEEAMRVLRAHDQQLRELFSNGIDDQDRDTLETLAFQQSLVLEKMQQARDLAANRLRNQRTTQSAISAYSTSRKI